jgi:hypothetical protein
MLSSLVELWRVNQVSFRPMEPRPSLRPLAPLIGMLAALWLITAGLIAAQLLAG